MQLKMLSIALIILLGAASVFAVPINTAVYNVDTETGVTEKGNETYFLPGHVSPKNYKIKINVSESFKNLKTFEGSVLINAIVNQNTKAIVMHALQLEINDTDITVTDSSQQTTTNIFNNTEYDPTRQFLTLHLKQTVQENTNIKINISKYVGTLRKDMSGFYISQYDELDASNKTVKKTVLTTQFEPASARKAFPCFDEPKYKATFDLTFTKPKIYRVISNMKSKEKDNGLNSETVTFLPTPKMSTYLIAFIVHEFQSTPSPDNNSYAVWSRPEAKNQTKWAAKYVYPIVANLSEITGIHYMSNDSQMTKMDMAALPDFSAGAMENWGLLTYRETALLVDDELSTERNIQRVVSVIAHEVTHQWFGNLITLTWWNNTWLNEGFATYFEYHATAKVLPDWEMKDQFVIEEQQSVFGIDALAKSTPLTHPVFTPSEISSHFGSISYNKGGSVIRMMEHFIGSDIFQKALQNYIKINKLKNTIPENLWSAVQEIVNKNNISLPYQIENIMSTWILQAGYPVISVKYDNGYLTLSQKRFYINSNENKPKGNEQTWYVPISYTTANESDYTNLKPKVWLTPQDPEKIVNVKKVDYVVVNIQESGYYRVNYDDNLWIKLADALKTDEGKKIHHLNKAQMVDDVLNLARAGLLDYTIAFGITDYLANETNYYPWYSAFGAFRFLLQRYSDNNGTGQELRTYLKNLMTELIKDKEFADKDGEKQVEIFNKVAALEWACNLEVKNCVDQAKKKFNSFKETNQTVLKNFRSIVYCTALRNGNYSDWEFLWKRFEKSNVAAEKIGIINALGCSNNITTLEAFLNKSIEANSGIRKQDASYVFSAVYTGTSQGVDVAFNFLKNNYRKIIESYNGMNALEKAVLGLSQRLTDKDKIKKFRELLTKNNDFRNFRAAAIETVDQNLAWAENYSSNITRILNNKRNPDPTTTTTAATTTSKPESDSATNIIINKYVLFVLGFISIYFSIFN